MLVTELAIFVTNTQRPSLLLPLYMSAKGLSGRWSLSVFMLPFFGVALLKCVEC